MLDIETKMTLETDCEIKSKLSKTCRIISKLNMDDMTFAHISARPQGADYFFINAFGFLFSEITEDKIARVELSNDNIATECNKTGYIMHRAIYSARQDINSIFHLHTNAGVAVSSLEKGLLPITQHALHFYDRVSYHKYDSLTLDPQSQAKDLVHSLGSVNKTMFLENHGTITCGSTVHEAFFYAYQLEQACKVQCLINNTSSKIISPNKEVCEKAAHDLLSFEQDLGLRDWTAACRMIENN